MNAAPGGLVRFGTFELDPRSGALRNKGARVNLPEQPLQVLKALLEHPGELVSREELRQRLWPADTYVDFEHGLNAAVRRLRDALGDSADVPRFVETLPRRGYRFIAPVAEPRRSDQSGPEGAGTADDGGQSWLRSYRRRPVLAAALTTALAALLAAASYLASSLVTTRPASTTTAIVVAVLPFENLTGDPDREYLVDGMTEEVITQLGSTDPARLGVIARTSAMHFKKTTKRADLIGSELGARYLVEGSVRTSGNRVRIAAQLIEAASGSHVWADQYERDATDLLVIQREAATAIARAVIARLVATPPSARAGGRRHSTNLEAYEHYLRGRYHWAKDSVEELDKAKAHFQHAIELDPTYALAHSGLADTYGLLGSYGVLPIGESHPLGRAAAEKAVEIDDTLAEAHTSLAAVLADYYWDWAVAERHYARAIELDPDYETALRYYSFYLGCTGRSDQALSLAARLRRLDPVSPAARMNLGMALYLARRYDEALTEFGETLQLAPDLVLAHVMRGRVYLAKGLPHQAIEHVEHARALAGSRPDVITPYAMMLGKAGRRQEALAALEEMRRLSKPREPAPFRMAMVYIGLGDTDRAFEWLQKAVDARDWQMVMLKAEPAFDELRSDPRFPGLLERVGLPR